MQTGKPDEEFTIKIGSNVLKQRICDLNLDVISIEVAKRASSLVEQINVQEINMNPIAKAFLNWVGVVVFFFSVVFVILGGYSTTALV